MRSYKVLSSLFFSAISMFAFVGATASGVASSAIDAGCFEKAKGASTTTTNLAGIPAILRIPSEITRPPIVLWHGFGAPATEEALMAVLPLDDVPAIKVYVGLPLFGKRAPTGGKDALVRRQKEDMAMLVFKPIVLEAANELPMIVRELKRQGCMGVHEKIGLFGFSAGGASALISLAERKVAISSAVLLNPSTGLSASIQALEHATGIPYHWTPESHALARRTDAIERVADIVADRPPTALLVLTGTEDNIIAQESLTTLRYALTHGYDHAHSAERFRQSVIEGLPHNLAGPPADQELGRQVASWFNTYQKPS